MARKDRLSLSTRPKIIDLCSGAGLFSGGFCQAGFDVAHAIDVDAEAIASYRKNVSAMAVVGDISRPQIIADARVLIAGPPCQGFSTLGRRDPKDDRNKTALSVLKWIFKNDIDVAVIENVPPFIQSIYWRRIAKELERSGYSVQVWTLNSKDFGCAQDRSRAFTIASRIGIASEPRSLKTSPTVRDVIIDRAIDPFDPLHQAPPLTEVRRRRLRLIPEGGDKRDIMKANPSLCPPSWWKMGAQATDAWGRMHADEPSNTLRCCFQNPSKGRYLHPIENRPITLREGARLQGVPDNWEFVGSRTSIARQIGNGVPVQLAKAVATQIKKLFISPVRRMGVA